MSVALHRRRWVVPVVVVALCAVAGGVSATAATGGLPSGGRHWHPKPSHSATPRPTVSASRTGAASATPSPSAVSPSLAVVPSAGTAGIWRPAPGTRWQWQIVGAVGSPLLDVAMYDVDLTDAVPATTTVAVAGFGTVTWPKGANAGIVDRLHAAGKIAICYLDTGAYETYEPDARLFPGTPGWTTGDPTTDVIGDDTGWDGEYWLDIRPTQRPRFAPILWARLDLAKRIGCDGVEPDQNNPVGNNPGPPITLADQKTWYLEVAHQAHARGLSVGMKNGIEVTDADTVAAFDWNLNEECFFYDECDLLAPFVAAGKAVFQVEYTEDWSERGLAAASMLAGSAQICVQARQRQFATLIKDEVPDSSFVAC